MIDYDNGLEPRFKEGDLVHLTHTEEERRYEDQDNEDGPHDGETIYGDVAGPGDLLTVVSYDWESGGYVYHLENEEGSRLWSVPEEDLSRVPMRRR